MDCRVTVEAAVSVYDVESVNEAVSIAISKTGEMLNPDLSYVDISKASRTCEDCGEQLESGYVAADEGLVGLELEMTVFGVEGEEHAARVARKEIGEQLSDVPLSVSTIETVEEDGDETDASEDDADTSEEITPEPSNSDDDLPEFEELMED